MMNREGGRAFGRLLFVAAALAVADAAAVEFQAVEFAGKKFTVCRVDVTKESVQLFHRDDSGVPFKRFERITEWLKPRGQKLAFAMNAGMYHGDFSAVGLFVAEGKELSPLNLADGKGNFFLKPNGVFAITDKGARVMESSEYPKLRERVLLATQSGPLLLRREDPSGLQCRRKVATVSEWSRRVVSRPGHLCHQ